MCVHKQMPIQWRLVHRSEISTMLLCKLFKKGAQRNAFPNPLNHGATCIDAHTCRVRVELSWCRSCVCAHRVCFSGHFPCNLGPLFHSSLTAQGGKCRVQFLLAVYEVLERRRSSWLFPSTIQPVLRSMMQHPHVLLLLANFWFPLF
jgi:hypothetical protein